MGFVHEVVLRGVQRGKTINNIFHVWDGAETKSPDDVADVFENNFLVDLAIKQVSEMTWTQIIVTPLDVGNLDDPISRAINIVGTVVTEDSPTSIHAWVKLLSTDAGFRAGGKMINGLNEAQITDGVAESGYLDNLQTIFEDLLADLIVAGLTLAIYRPVLSTPGFPSISTVVTVLARGLGSNNRRQQDFQRS